MRAGLFRSKRRLFNTGWLASCVILLNFPAFAAAAPQLVWSKTFPNNPFIYSSPIPVRANGGAEDIIVGSAAPYSGGGFTASDARTFDGDTGATLHTFSVPTNGISVADVNGDGLDDIFIGAGGTEVNCQGDGGLFSFSTWGALRFAPQHFPDNTGNVGAQCDNPSIFSAPAIGDINKDGVADLSFGALGLKAWTASADTGQPNYGWPFYWDDTQAATPALADITGDGQTEVIFAGDSSPGGPVDWRGGMVRAFTGKGQQLWEYRINEIVHSSPSIGDINGDGDIEIVFGAGNYWSQQPGGASDCSKVTALRRNGTLLWQKDIGAQIMASPTLADVNGDGVLDVVVGGWRRPCSPPAATNDGRIWALDGRTGNALPGYPVDVNGQLIIGQIVTADVNGDGAQDPIVPTAQGVHILNGPTGAELYRLRYGEASYKNSPLVMDADGNGQVDLFMAGTEGDGSTGIIERYEFQPGDNSTLGSKGWPMAHKDPRQTSSWSTPPLLDAPSGNLGQGYWMVASDGGVFPFGSAKGYGSTGNIRLNQPMVGMASTADGKGYWLVAADGGVFPFGDAVGRGSTGNIRLNKPIVGMAATPSGNGYWLVASDGGVFPFGDAVGYGSTGNLKLRQPIVGMERTNDGGGYWLVAADGGIFPFGDAGSYGSTGNIQLRQPIVGMSRTADGHGYWLAAADGGIFPFGDAVGHGSAGNLNLTKPVNGIAHFPTDGYTMVASDGGTFSYGAINYGSLGGLPLNKPVVGLSAVGGN